MTPALPRALWAPLWPLRGGMGCDGPHGPASLELRGVGEGFTAGKEPRCGSRPLPGTSSTEAQAGGVEAVQVSGNGTEVVRAPVCGVGTRDFVQHVWGFPDVHPNVLVLRM